MKNKAIILLSAGLDSVVSLYYALKKTEVILALTFDYGQRAAADEINCAKKITEKFGIDHEVIELPFLKKETKNALVDDKMSLDFEKMDENSAKSVWIPNRNGLFVNIAAIYAEARNADFIIIGANKEEAETFPDNSFEFTKCANKFFEFSTLKKPKIMAPLIELEKSEIIKLGIDLGVDFSLIKSCYDFRESKKHCGVCESCKRLKNAIVKSGNLDLIKLLF